MSNLKMLFALFLISYCSASYSLSLIVQPINDSETTKRNYLPLAKYLEHKTGIPIELKVAQNFLTYWMSMKKNNKYDLIIDAAHFTDYRVNKMQYDVVAKVPSRVSYTLVSNEDEQFFDPEELISKRVVLISSPNIGALMMYKLFPSVIEQPVIVAAKTSQEAIKILKKGKASAALIPTPLVNSFEGLAVITTTDTIPAPAFSVSPNVSKTDKEKIKQALLDAINTSEGRSALKSATLIAFDDADNDAYKGYKQYLRETWGY